MWVSNLIRCSKLRVNMVFDYLFAMRSNPRLIDFNRLCRRTCNGRAWAPDFWLLLQKLPVKCCYLGLTLILAHFSSLNWSAVHLTSPLWGGRAAEGADPGCFQPQSSALHTSTSDLWNSPLSHPQGVSGTWSPHQGPVVLTLALPAALFSHSNLSHAILGRCHPASRGPCQGWDSGCRNQGD